MDGRSDERVIIFDTTLRDGEQAPGCSMTLREKLRVAGALRDLQVDVIEAGFAAASPGDFDAVQAIAEQIKGPAICSLARCHPDDVARAAAAVKPAEKSRIHVFVATSEIHRNLKLQMAKEEIIRRAVESVKLAREHCDDVEFSAEDASRTDHGYLAEVVQAVIEAGARTINIPDTVGYTVPAEFEATLHTPFPLHTIIHILLPLYMLSTSRTPLPVQTIPANLLLHLPSSSITSYLHTALLSLPNRLYLSFFCP